MIEPLNSIRLLRTLGIGASIGAAVSGGVYLWFTWHADSVFYAMVLLGAMTGTGIHGLLRYIFGQREKHRKLETDVLYVKSLRDTGFIDKQEAQEIINELVETTMFGKRLSDSKR